MTAHHHSGNFGLDGLKLMVGGLAIAFVLTGCGAARTRGATTTGLSGLELFSGKAGASAPGTLFARKDNDLLGSLGVGPLQLFDLTVEHGSKSVV
jgi:hypothetical protein